MKATLHSLYTRVVKHRYFVIPFTGLMAVYGIVWLAFYPGIMTPDSLDQWGQVLAGKYNNGSPYLSTIIMGMFRPIFDTPAWMGLIQMTFTAGLFSLGVWYGHRKGVRRWILALVLVVAVISPTILLYNVTLWKDILYSQLIVILTLLTAMMVIGKSHNRALYIVLGVLAASIAALRYNGIIFLVLPVLALLVFIRHNRRLIVWHIGTTVVVYMCLAFALPHVLKVEPAPIMMEWLRMKNVGAVYNDKTATITPGQHAIFEQVLSRADWEEYYTCAHPDGLALREENGTRHKYTETLFADAAKEQQWKDAVITVALTNPKPIVWDKVCMAGYFMQRKPNVVVGISKRADLPVVEEDSKLPKVKTAITEYAYFTHETPLLRLAHLSIGAYTAVFTVGAVVAFVRRKNGLLVFCILNLANIAFTILVGFSSDFRYAYSAVLALPLLPIVWLADKGGKSRLRLALRHKKTAK